MLQKAHNCCRFCLLEGLFRNFSPGGAWPGRKFREFSIISANSGYSGDQKFRQIPIISGNAGYTGDPGCSGDPGDSEIPSEFPEIPDVLSNFYSIWGPKSLFFECSWCHDWPDHALSLLTSVTDDHFLIHSPMQVVAWFYRSRPVLVDFGHGRPHAGPS